MLAICIECSHQRGMGHLFRAINLIQTLEKKGKAYALLMNDDENARNILKNVGISPIIVDLHDFSSDWEGKLIREMGMSAWLNDRLDTERATAAHVKEAGLPLFTIDDMGEGAALADGNFASLIFDPAQHIPGKRVYAGCRYLILNPEIARYRRERQDMDRILVTLGGSDTYGVTLRVIDFLKRWLQRTGLHKEITILLGPGSAIRREAETALSGTDFRLVCGVESLIAFFAQFDLAITGGGVTALEAAASGLPCMVIANELHEIQIGQYLEQGGAAVFAGYYQDLEMDKLEKIRTENVAEMSRRGMAAVDLSGAERICQVIFESGKRMPENDRICEK